MEACEQGQAIVATASFISMGMTMRNTKDEMGASLTHTRLLRMEGRNFPTLAHFELPANINGTHSDAEVAWDAKSVQRVY